MEGWINIVLLTMLAVITVAIIRLRNLFSVVILGGVYSSLMVGIMVLLDAVDVAMTELAVGTGISTALMLAALHLTKIRETAPSTRVCWFPLLLVTTVGVLILCIWEPVLLVASGNSVQGHVDSYYLEKSLEDTGIPNVVTSVLGSYRGFDTLGETAVIFAAGIAVLMLLRGAPPVRCRNLGSAQKEEGESPSRRMYDEV